MTQRSIPAGTNQMIIIKVGDSVRVTGYESDLVTAQSTDRWGLTVERKPESEFARARAVVGEHVLFDLRFKAPSLQGKDVSAEVIEIKMGGSGEVLVPYACHLKIYAGKDIDVQGVRGVVDAFSGFRMNLADVACLGNASAGGSMSLDCQTMLGTNVEFKAGSDLRFHVADLTSAQVRVKDLGGYWEGRIGAAEKQVFLKCGGDVTLVTDQQVEPVPPHYILGRIEKPSS